MDAIDPKFKGSSGYAGPFSAAQSFVALFDNEKFTAFVLQNDNDPNINLAQDDLGVKGYVLSRSGNHIDVKKLQ